MCQRGWVVTERCEPYLTYQAAIDALDTLEFKQVEQAWLDRARVVVESFRLVATALEGEHYDGHPVEHLAVAALRQIEQAHVQGRASEAEALLMACGLVPREGPLPEDYVRVSVATVL